MPLHTIPLCTVKYVGGNIIGCGNFEYKNDSFNIYKYENKLMYKENKNNINNINTVFVDNNIITINKNNNKNVDNTNVEINKNNNIREFRNLNIQMDKDINKELIVDNNERLIKNIETNLQTINNTTLSKNNFQKQIERNQYLELNSINNTLQLMSYRNKELIKQSERKVNSITIEDIIINPYVSLNSIDNLILSKNTIIEQIIKDKYIELIDKDNIIFELNKNTANNIKISLDKDLNRKAEIDIVNNNTNIKIDTNIPIKIKKNEYITVKRDFQQEVNYIKSYKNIDINSIRNIDIVNNIININRINDKNVDILNSIYLNKIIDKKLFNINTILPMYRDDEFQLNKSITITTDKNSVKNIMKFSYNKLLNSNKLNVMFKNICVFALNKNIVYKLNKDNIVLTLKKNITYTIDKDTIIGLNKNVDKEMVVNKNIFTLNKYNNTEIFNNQIKFINKSNIFNIYNYNILDLMRENNNNIFKTINPILNKFSNININNDKQYILNKSGNNIHINAYDITSLEVIKRWWILEVTNPYDKKILPIDYNYSNPILINSRIREYGNLIEQNNHPISFMPYLENDKGIDLNYGLNEINLSIEIMIEMINIIGMIIQHSSSQFANCSGQETMEFIMEILLHWLNLDTIISEMNIKGSREHYLRAYRWIRWEAEKVWFMADKDHSQDKMMGLKYSGILFANLIDYMKYHQFDIVPLWRNLKYMDIERQFNRQAINGDIIKDLNKLKGERHYVVETQNFERKNILGE